VGQNLITRVTELTSSRFDRIDRLVNLTRLSLIEENRQMQNLKMEGYTAQRLLSVVVEQIGKIITSLQKTESLYLALKDFSVCRLSHHLIETEILQDHLNILRETIKRHNPKAKKYLSIRSLLLHSWENCQCHSQVLARKHFGCRSECTVDPR